LVTSAAVNLKARIGFGDCSCNLHDHTLSTKSRKAVLKMDASVSEIFPEITVTIPTFEQAARTTLGNVHISALQSRIGGPRA